MLFTHSEIKDRRDVKKNMWFICFDRCSCVCFVYVRVSVSNSFMLMQGASMKMVERAGCVAVVIGGGAADGGWLFVDWTGGCSAGARLGSHEEIPSRNIAGRPSVFVKSLFRRS